MWLSYLSETFNRLNACVFEYPSVWFCSLLKPVYLLQLYDESCPWGEATYSVVWWLQDISQSWYTISSEQNKLRPPCQGVGICNHWLELIGIHAQHELEISRHPKYCEDANNKSLFSLCRQHRNLLFRRGFFCITFFSWLLHEKAKRVINIASYRINERSFSSIRLLAKRDEARKPYIFYLQIQGNRCALSLCLLTIQFDIKNSQIDASSCN